MSEPSNPDLCARCGRCCYYKEPHPDPKSGFRFRITRKPCEFLGPDKRCAVYAQRHKIRHCRSAQDSALDRHQPNECGYAKMIPGYKSVVDFRPLDG